MRGDELARGQKSATFMPPRRKLSSDEINEQRIPDPAPEANDSENDETRAKRVASRTRYRGYSCGDELFVEPVSRTNDASFIIPKSAQGKTNIGYVMCVGPQVNRCKKGQLVVFNEFASYGKEIKIVDEQGDERDWLLLNDLDILARLERIEDEL